MNRPSQYRGVYQRCNSTCPPRDGRCRTHMWSFHVELPDGPDGKRRQVTKGGFSTPKEAEAARQDVLREHRDGTLPRDGGKRPLGAYLLEHLALKIERGELRDTTADSYRHYTDLLVVKLGRVKLVDLTPQMIERTYLDLMRERQVGPTTVRRIHAVVSGALRAAHKSGLVPRNVGSLVTLPKSERPKVRPWSAQQYGMFLAWVEEHEPRWLPPYLVAGLSGLRRGELAALRWDDIDLTTGVVAVERQRVSVPGNRRRSEPATVVERTTKTAAGERVAFLPPAACTVLRQWRTVQLRERLAAGEAYQDGGYLFCWEDGRPYHPETITKTFSRLARRASLPHVRLHDLRHLAASLHLAAGTEMGVVSKLLGHSSVKITIDTYSHLAEQTGRDAVERAAGLVPWTRSA